jgi:histone deacetylase complex regulatory component SIN3
MKNTQVFSLTLLLSLFVATPAFVIAESVAEETNNVDKKNLDGAKEEEPKETKNVYKEELDGAKEEEPEEVDSNKNVSLVNRSFDKASDCLKKYLGNISKTKFAVVAIVTTVVSGVVCEVYSNGVSSAFKKYVLGQDVIDEEDTLEAEIRAMLEAAEKEETEKV